MPQTITHGKPLLTRNTLWLYEPPITIVKAKNLNLNFPEDPQGLNKFF